MHMVVYFPGGVNLKRIHSRHFNTLKIGMVAVFEFNSALFKFDFRLAFYRYRVIFYIRK